MLFRSVHACERPGSKWKIIASLDDFNNVFTTAKQQGKGGQVMVLREMQEPLEGLLRGAKVVDASMFELSIGEVDKQ